MVPGAYATQLTHVQLAIAILLVIIVTMRFVVVLINEHDDDDKVGIERYTHCGWTVIFDDRIAIV